MTSREIINYFKRDNQRCKQSQKLMHATVFSSPYVNSPEIAQDRKMK